jgi:hypothetical protein
MFQARLRLPSAGVAVVLAAALAPSVLRPLHSSETTEVAADDRTGTGGEGTGLDAGPQHQPSLHEFVVRFGEKDFEKAEVVERLRPLTVSKAERVIPRRGDLFDVTVESDLPAEQVLGQIRKIPSVTEARPRFGHRLEFVVVFRDKALPEQEVAKRFAPLTVVEAERLGQYYEVVIETDLSQEKALEQIRRAPGVQAVEPNVKYYKKVPSQTAHPASWWGWRPSSPTSRAPRWQRSRTG